MRGAIQTSSARTGDGTDQWGTPPEVLERVRQVSPDGRIALDPCTIGTNPVGAESFFTIDHDGLSREWSGYGGLVYVNMPYSELDAWSSKMHREATLGVAIVTLLPARTDTLWWRRLWPHVDACAFWHGRIHFRQISSPPSAQAPLWHDEGRVGPVYLDGGPATFASAILGINVSQRRFRQAFSDVGSVVVP